jgi:hypothetical protein
MSILRSKLKIDVLKMEDAFFTNYQEGENVSTFPHKTGKVRKKR